MRITPAGAGKTKSSSVRLFAHRDHPRGCGENYLFRFYMTPSEGSPPRMRGKPPAPEQEQPVVGITPADAGKTVQCSVAFWPKKDHPRGCGENITSSGYKSSTVGSPPQVRGKPTMQEFKQATNRITPAGAGKTKLRAAYHVVAQDHPRRCGENAFMAVCFGFVLGSPPQVRGKRSFSSADSASSGITPAGAGKTLRRCRQSRQHRDHPRRCGENTLTNSL